MKFRRIVILLSLAFIIFQVTYFTISWRQEQVTDVNIQLAKDKIENLKILAQQSQANKDTVRALEITNVEIKEQDKLISDLKKTKKSIDAIPIGFETILIIIFVFYFFYEQLKESITPIYDQFFFLDSHRNDHLFIGFILHVYSWK